MFRACFQELKDGGNTVIAYIYSQYGVRNLSDMENDVNKWIDDYGFDLIDGVFIDETMSGLATNLQTLLTRNVFL